MLHFEQSLLVGLGNFTNIYKSLKNYQLFAIPYPKLKHGAIKNQYIKPAEL
jgi:hypothetical protein